MVATGLLVIIRDLNLVDISTLPSKTDPILIVDPNTVLPASIRPQPFEAIAWWCSELDKIFYAINLIKLSSSHLPQISRTGFPSFLGIDAVEYCLGSSIRERTYHRPYYNGTRNSPQ